MLNKSQQQAMEYVSGPLLIVAGAGTGKTTVITKKIAYLIEQKLAKPEEILALTFTDKTAEEMLTRVDEMLDIGYSDIQISTFHAFCQKILELYGLDAGLPNQFKLLTQTDAWLLIKKNFNKFNLDYYRPLGNPTKHIHELIKHFSKCKDELVSPEDYLRYAEEQRLNGDNAEFVSKNTSYKLQDTNDTPRLIEVANAYHVYNQLLLDNNSLDFGDLIYYTVKLLEKRPQILKSLQERYKFILVDEFQDVNWSQYYLVRMLATGQLTVVGDDDQCLPKNTKIKTVSGTKNICDIKKGDSVLSAVGKGYYVTSKILQTKKTTKNTEFIKIKTENGHELELTDNHIVFCYTPDMSDKKHFFVYLMERQDWGWRIGITNDPAVRLRLERGADRIIILKSCHSAEEARFYETIFSLKYNIPTICFKERNGTQNKEWLKRVFSTIDTRSNARRLANELNIDLNMHHYSLSGVSRGEMRRVKINLEMCHRNYGVKLKYGCHRQAPAISHKLQIETSDRKAIDCLLKMGLRPTKAKKGVRLRMTNVDFAYLQNIAKQVAVVSGGIIEYGFKIARFKGRTRKALMMPAKNLVEGLFVPVFNDENLIVFEQISKIEKKKKRETVFDLEVERTNNFIANNIVIHNSIYAFRGASVSNILRFKEDYPKAKEIVLTENYRSGQEILDIAYKSIQNNNPDRLETKLKIKKNLKSSILNLQSKIEHIHCATLEDEVHSVITKINDIHSKESVVWDDIAILVRANSHTEPFISALERAGIPYEFLASSGLYRQPIVLDCVNFLRVVDNYHESTAVYRLLRMPFLNFKENDLQKINYSRDKKSVSFYEAIKRAAEYGLSKEGIDVCDKLVGWIHEGMKRARYEKPGAVLLGFLEDSGYLAHITREETKGNAEIIRQIYHLKQYFDYIHKYEEVVPGAHVSDFMEHFSSVLESGDEGNLYQPTDTPDSVNIITIHKAKGLEFKYVFVVNLVEDKFPSRRRGDGIELPSALIKEKLPEGDFHIQEERRLFYVAVTRAKEGLFLTSADDYGGARAKKVSRFLDELGYKVKSESKPNQKVTSYKLQVTKQKVEKSEMTHEMPKSFSFSALNSYRKCPYQYKLSYILQIPTKGSHYFSFGQSIHSTLHKFYTQVQILNSAEQGDLFGQRTIDNRLSTIDQPRVPTIDELLKMYDASWIDDWYQSKDQKDKYYKKGKDILKEFYESNKDKWTIPVALEGWFKLKIGDYFINGRMDRVDKLPDGTLQIIDYKTGQSKEKIEGDDKNQLLIYQLAANSVQEYKNLGYVSNLTFFYLENNLQISFLGDDDDLVGLKDKLLETIENIKSNNFTAAPSEHLCSHCDFKDICEFRKL